jgi:hypothetical protein
MRSIVTYASMLALCAASATASAQQTPADWPATAATQAAPAGTMAPQPMLPRARDGEIIDSQGGDAIPALPLTVMSNGTMKYVTGGIGSEELDQLKSIENEFNVQLLVATKDGGFLSDVTARVIDTKDTVLFTVDNVGPYFYLYLPPADYLLEITMPGGSMKTLKVKAPASGATKPVVRF